jgi:hypothetical protein
VESNISPLNSGHTPLNELKASNRPAIMEFNIILECKIMRQNEQHAFSD